MEGPIDEKDIADAIEHKTIEPQISQETWRISRLESIPEEGEAVKYEDLGKIESIKKTAKNGVTVLIPQPTSDANDPLNWSPARKHTILFIISFAALLPDYGSATGAVTLLQQATVWDMRPDTVNHTQAGNLFMLGAGGLFVVAFSAYFGRLPVLFWFLLVATATAAWCAAARSFDYFMASRVINGFFSSVAQGGGLMFINDIFFFHERTRKINIWSTFVILSPYLGPLISAFITSTQSWVWAFAVYSILTGISLVATVCFVPETYYNREIYNPSRKANGPRILTLTGIHQLYVNLLEPNTFLMAMTRPFKVLSKPTVLLSVIYYFLTFAWVVGINRTLSMFLVSLYGWGPRQIGCFYFTPIIAILLGQLIGHWLHDLIGLRYIYKHDGHFEPEVRLHAIIFGLPFMAGGLVLVGFSLENVYHYMITSLGWGMYVFGIMITTVALNAYNLDCFPEASGEVAAWMNFARTTGGFLICYVQVQWSERQGPRQSFSIQAAIVAAAFFIILALMKWGKSMRLKSGTLGFKTS